MHTQPQPKNAANMFSNHGNHNQTITQAWAQYRFNYKKRSVKKRQSSTCKNANTKRSIK